jgi:hypothetical protein
MHAMTEHGLLVADSEAVDITDDLTVVRNSAEYIYRYIEDKSKDDESPAMRTDKFDDKDAYHHNVNSDLYVKWLANRCIPAFKAKFPGRKMILVIDNASYHDAHVDDWKAVCSLNKKELIAMYDKFGIDEFDDGSLRYDSDGKVCSTDVVKIVTYHRRNFEKRASPATAKFPLSSS